MGASWLVVQMGALQARGLMVALANDKAAAGRVAITIYVPGQHIIIMSSGQGVVVSAAVQFGPTI